MKTLYLHIGTPKTATTSLQHFCAENAETFQQEGYCYPIFPHKFKHINILRNAFFLSYKCQEKNQKRNYIEEELFFHQGIRFILKNFKEYDNVIMTDEAIWNVVFKRGKPDLWKKLKKEAVKHGFVIKVVVYLRRQDSLATSWWNQKVKNGKRVYSTTSWEDFVKDPSKLELEYYKPLKIIEESIGKENMIIRRFGKQYFKNGSIFEDFADAIGLSYSDQFVISNEERNIRLMGNTHEIKRILNSLPGLTDEDNIFFKHLLISISEGHTELKKQTMFSAEEARTFMEQYRKDNQKVMQEYFGIEDDLFDMDFSKNQKWVLSHTEMEEDIIRFTGSALAELQKENHELKEHLKNLEKDIFNQKRKLAKIN